MVYYRCCVIYYINEYGREYYDFERMSAKAYAALKPHMYDWKPVVKSQAKSEI